MMEAIIISETPVNLYGTSQRNIPEDSHLHTPRRENVKSHEFQMRSVRMLPSLLEEQATVT
jgi:hypothetical protein